MPVFSTLHDEQKVETINLSQAKTQVWVSARIGIMPLPDAYTNQVFLFGAHGKEIDLSGVFVPNLQSSGIGTNLPFPNVGVGWVTSSGADPIPTLERWERQGTRLQFNDETGSITSCAITHFSYDLIPGQALTLAVFYKMKIKEGVSL